MPYKSSPIQIALLVIWILLIALAGWSFVSLGPARRGSREFASGSLIKVGIVMALAWLAMPQLERLGWQRLRGTGIAIIMAIGGLTAVKPRFGAVAAGVVFGAFLVLTVLGWARGIIFNAPTTAVTGEKRGKIEKNPTKR